MSTLGSNAGIIVTTYESEGTNIDKAIQNFKGILEGL